MAEWKPLRMLGAYSISPDNLSEEALAGLSSIDTGGLEGSTNAYTGRQALSSVMGGIDLPTGQDPGEVLDKLCACADERSELYSPGFLTLIEHNYPYKRHIVAWLVRFYGDTELKGGLPRGNIEKKAFTKRFMKRHNISDRAYSRIVSELENPTKQKLLRLLRRRLLREHKDKLIAKYETVFRTDPVEELAAVGPVEVQGMLFR